MLLVAVHIIVVKLIMEMAIVRMVNQLKGLLDTMMDIVITSREIREMKMMPLLSPKPR